MVTRLFASKSANSSSRDKTPPPPPPASHKPKSPFLPTIGKPPRKRPTNLPIANGGGQCRPPHGPSSSKTPPAATFRAPSLETAGHAGCRPQGHQPAADRSSVTLEGYMDLTRTRSDESLLWTAEEEASALVAELRASLSGNTASDNSINRSSFDPCPSSKSFPNNPYLYKNSFPQHSPAAEVVPIVPPRPTCHVIPQQNPFQRSFSVHKRSTEAREAAQKLSQVPPPRCHSFTDLQSAVELLPLQSGPCGSPLSATASRLGGSGNLTESKPVGGASPRLKSFGGSWKSLLRGK